MGSSREVIMVSWAGVRNYTDIPCPILLHGNTFIKLYKGTVELVIVEFEQILVAP